MSNVFVDQDRNDHVICPMDGRATIAGYSPQADRHSEWVAIQDEVYGRYGHDEDNELVGGEEAERAYGDEINRLAQERLGVDVRQYEDRMHLFAVTATPAWDARGGRGQHFTAGYLQCPICLFVLPGQMVSNRP